MVSQWCLSRSSRSHGRGTSTRPDYVSARTNQQLCELPVIVLELESYQLTSRQKARCVRDAQLEDEYPCNMVDIYIYVQSWGRCLVASDGCYLGLCKAIYSYIAPVKGATIIQNGEEPGWLNYSYPNLLGVYM